MTSKLMECAGRATVSYTDLSQRTVATHAKSSVRSAMSIGKRAPLSAKLRRSGMVCVFARRPPNLRRAEGPFMPLLRSLSRSPDGRYYRHGAPNGAWLTPLCAQGLSLLFRLLVLYFAFSLVSPSA